MQVTGILVFENLEGGFWGIVGSDGSRYEIENKIPDDVSEPGLEVEAEVEPTGGVSFRQWGNPVKVIQIKRA